MCELLGFSSSLPAYVKYSLHEFARHGGAICPNKSGWGIAYKEGRDVVLFKEPAPASDSSLVKFIESHPLQTTCAIAHVRYATAGSPNYANTHPFVRELGGQQHVFAHNGELKEISQRMPLGNDGFRPVGETDSEHAFCFLLNRLRLLWRQAPGTPPLTKRMDIVARTAAELRLLGTANFLYSDGDVLFVHAHRRRWVEGGHISEPRPPGLSLSEFGATDLATRGLDVKGLQPETVMALVASVPLTADGWMPLPEGVVLALSAGREMARVEP